MAQGACAHVPRPRPLTGFEGVPTGLLGDLLTKAKNDIKGAQSRADLIRRELKRRKKHTTR
ncbi:hypothetical protein SAMN02800692_2010 [Luteibacter sp. UNC138MFCol5.1]|nr:hypothetical protein SAMN02800692_2010 [Luteibacter sp. UNC138MFCol5.1]